MITRRVLFGIVFLAIAGFLADRAWRNYQHERPGTETGQSSDLTETNGQ